MSYIDGFLCPVPTANREPYRAFAAKAAEIFKEFGAIRVVEAWADDVPEGEVTSFTMAVQRKEDEATIFSWIEWPSKEVRDEAWAKVMADPRMQPENNEVPFDGKRVIYGGFDPIVDV